MKVLVACEFSGTVREAFAEWGHEAWSCDLLPSEKPGKHLQGNVLEFLDRDWDLLIAHPPCTHLASSGARWFKNKRKEQKEAISFFLALAEAPIEKKCIENPVGIMSSLYGKPDQIIQPWQFGHGETKATCLWLTGLPNLVSTKTVSGRENRIHRMSPSPDRWAERSRTYSGIAQAMAGQWGFGTV